MNRANIRRALPLASFLLVLAASQAWGGQATDDYISSLALSEAKRNLLLAQSDVMERILASGSADSREKRRIAADYLHNAECLARAYAARGEDPGFMESSRHVTELVFDTPEKYRVFLRFMAFADSVDAGSIRTGGCGED